MKQQRNTKQRQLVLETVRSRHDHPSADQIYLDVRARDSRVSRGTVYRNLHLLAENGEILHVKVPGADRFDSRLIFHYHMLCTECRTVCDVPLPYDETRDSVLSELTGYAINRHRTIFEGICSDCLARSE